VGLLSRIQEHAAPDVPALAYGGQTLSYAELLNASARLSRDLPPGPLALRMPNCAEGVVAVLAAMRAGSDLLLLDASLKEAETKDACGRAGVRALMLRSGDRVEGLACIAVPAVTSIAEVSGSIATPTGPAHAPGFMLLSSGTTGSPKIVLRTAQQAEAAVDLFRAELPLCADDRVLAGMPFCHSFGLLFVLLGSLCAGARLHLDPFSPRGTARGIATDRITVLPATPFMFRMLAETAFDPPPDFSSVRLAVSAGSGLPPSVAMAFHARFGVDILQSYGSTETGPVALARPQHGSGVGRPYQGVELELGTAEQPKPILVRSPALAAGYLGDERASAEVFLPEGVAIGDLGFLDGLGNVVVAGRDRPMLSVGGKKVSPAEVEACLKSHPAVVDAVVVGVPAADGGHSLKAVLVAGPGLSVPEVQAHVAERLALFKVPREIHFASEGERTSLGKVKYGADR
jgi:long-chain acyl-CoA synthetase